MSEYAYDGNLGGVDPVDDAVGVDSSNDDQGIDAPDVASEPEWSGPSREEWAATQERLAEARDLVQAVNAQSEQLRLQEAEAEREQALATYLGDEWEDPDGFAERAAEIQALEIRRVLDALVEQRVAPIEAAHEAQLIAEADREAPELFASALEAAGVEGVDPVAELAALNARLEVGMQMYPDVQFGREEAIQFMRIYANELAQKLQAQRGDEMSLVRPGVFEARYLEGKPPRAAAERPQYKNEAHRQMAEFVLGKQ